MIPRLIKGKQKNIELVHSYYRRWRLIRIIRPRLFNFKKMETKQKKEIFKMTTEDKSRKIELAEKKLRQAQAEYKKALREEKEKNRKAKDRHKYMIGGCVLKCFPEAYDFNEHEINRIIACAFSLKDVRNMIVTVLKERPNLEAEFTEEETENNDFDSHKFENNNSYEGDYERNGNV